MDARCESSATRSGMQSSDFWKWLADCLGDLQEVGG